VYSLGEFEDVVNEVDGFDLGGLSGLGGDGGDDDDDDEVLAWLLSCWTIDSQRIDKVSICFVF
jgi:hypothetical protein